MRLLQPLHVYISTLFCAMTLLVGGLIGGMSYHISADVVQTAANEQWARIDQAVQQELHSTLEPAEMALQFLRLHRITWSASLQERLNSLSALSQVLKGARSVSAVYVAYPNGDFFLLRVQHTTTTHHVCLMMAQIFTSSGRAIRIAKKF